MRHIPASRDIAVGLLLAAAVVLSACGGPEQKVRAACRDKGYDPSVCDCVVRTLRDGEKLDWTADHIDDPVAGTAITASAAGCKLAG